jgi:hypothetical protein
MFLETWKVNIYEIAERVGNCLLYMAVEAVILETD